MRLDKLFSCGSVAPLISRLTSATQGGASQVQGAKVQGQGVKVQGQGGKVKGSRHQVSRSGFLTAGLDLDLEPCGFDLEPRDLDM